VTPEEIAVDIENVTAEIRKIAEECVLTEREACAKIADEHASTQGADGDSRGYEIALAIARDIRARGA
jgi:hypothetical protein